MTSHYDDEAQIEDLKRWWKENWKALGLGLVIGLVGVAGFQQWKAHGEKQDALAASLYSSLGKEADAHQPAAAASIGARLTKDFDGTPYAALGQLRLAQLAAEGGHFDDAATHLKWAAAHASDPGMASIAKLRLAQVDWQLGKPDDALGELAQPATGFEPVYQRLRGDILLSQGKRADARRAYLAALAALPQDASDRGNLQHAIDNLADAASS